MGGGSKVFAQTAPSRGVAHCCHIKRRSDGNAADCKVLGRRFESWSVDCRQWCRRHIRRTGFGTADQKVCSQLVSCIAIQPRLALSQQFSPLLGAASATDKKPKLCVSV